MITQLSNHCWGNTTCRFHFVSNKKNYSTTEWWQSARGCGARASAPTRRTSDVENFTWEYEQRRLGATATRELPLCRDFVWSKVAGSGGVGYWSFPDARIMTIFRRRSTSWQLRPGFGRGAHACFTVAALINKVQHGRALSLTD